MRKFEEQFPEAIDLIARALRAGHAFTTGLAMVAEEAPQPMAGEFRLLYDQQNFGMPLPDALKAFGRTRSAARRAILRDRCADPARERRQPVGDPGQPGDVIRERFKVKRQVRVISAHGRITGWCCRGCRRRSRRRS